MKLDFLVIGAQKGGTTSLWQYLREHPQLCMPESKEAALFTANPDPAKLPAYMQALFAGADPDALLGKVTPDYMVGAPGCGVETVAGRIASALPEVKLIALLRDPIERAISSYTMAVRRGQEKRSVNAALRELLDADELAHARAQPSPTNSYIVAGEYGRMLSAYRDHFPADQLLVTYTDDLADEPAVVLDDVLEYLGLPTGFRPNGLGARHFRGGAKKLLDDPEAEARLFQFYEEEILPHMNGPALMHRRAFEFFYETWNVVPEEPPRITAHVRRLLEEHFHADAEKLGALGASTSWIFSWRRFVNV
jgi:hypothetical protein